MNEFKEYQEARENNREVCETDLEAWIQEELEKADRLIDSTAELLAEDSLLTKKEIIERNRREIQEKFGITPGDFGEIPKSRKEYRLSFGAGALIDSTIEVKKNQAVRAAADGNKIAMDNRLKDIAELEKKKAKDAAEKKAAEEREKAAKKALKK